MKGQSSLLVLLAVMVIMMGGWIFTSFYQAQIQESTVSEIETIFSKIGTYLNSIKGFSKNALILSVHKATSDIGTERLTFYCNDVTIPTTKQMRYELSSKTLNLLNDYIKNYPVTDPLMVIEIENFSCVDTPIEGLEQGLNDENFTANAYGSKIGISIKENNVSTNNVMLETIPENRFWFLYRNLRDWTSQEGKNFEKMVCDCFSKEKLPRTVNEMKNCDDSEWPEFTNCFREVINERAKNMQDFINDPNVECSGEPTCCYGQKERCPSSIDEQCGIGPGGTQCTSCNSLPDNELCIDTIGASSEKSYGTNEKIKNIVSFDGEPEGHDISVISFAPEEFRCGGPCTFYESGYINVKAQFTCTDKKYQLSLPFPEDRYLKFTIDTKISLQKNGINLRTTECEGIWPDCKCPGSPEDWCTADCKSVPGTVVTAVPTTPPIFPSTVPRPV